MWAQKLVYELKVNTLCIHITYFNRIRTGGGDSNDVGAIERRRQDASDLLNDAKDALGPEKYLDLVNLLKALNSRVLTIPEVRDGFAQLLESDRNNLLERFENFLPKQFRT